MISNTSNRAAESLTSALDAEGVCVEVLEGTALQELCLSNVSLRTQVNLESAYTDGMDTGTIIHDSRPDHGGGHNERMQEMSTRVSEIIRGNLALVRKNVIPLAKDILGEYVSTLGSIYTAEPDPVSIYPDIWKPIWSNSHFKSMINDYERVQQPSFVNKEHFPDITPGVLSDMLVIGIPTIDRMMDDWKESITPERMYEVYQQVFRPTNGGWVVLGSSTGVKHVSASGLRRDDLLMVWCFAKNLHRHVDGKSDMSLDRMRNVASLIEHASGHGIYKELEKRESIRRTKQLVYDNKKRHRKTDAQGDGVFYEIYVNNDVYVKWLTDGGSPEALFGTLVSEQAFNYDLMIEKKESLEKHWNKYQIRWEMIRSTRELNVKRIAFNRAFNIVLGSCDLKENNIFQSMDELRERIRSVGDNLHRMIYEDDRRLIRRGVCDICYPGSNARFILDTMAEVGSEYEIEDPREAASLTSLDLYCRWVGSQLKKIPN